MAKGTGKLKPRGTKAGREVVAALIEIKEALESGEPLSTRFTVREFEVVDPGSYNAAAVKATRARLKASQAVFAKIVGVSKVLIQSWESGARKPNGAARRVLDEINREPEHWAGFLGPVNPSG